MAAWGTAANVKSALNKLIIDAVDPTTLLEIQDEINGLTYVEVHSILAHLFDLPTAMVYAHDVEKRSEEIKRTGYRFEQQLVVLVNTIEVFQRYATQG